jgi:hypothetical protein
MKKTALTLCTLLSLLLGYSQNIRRETASSLYIEVYRDSLFLGSATAFVIRSKTTNYLITNYHVVTTKNAWDLSWMDPKRPISPNRIGILQNGPKLGDHVLKWENLLTNHGDTLWLRNTIGNQMVDVIELPLKDTLGVTFYPINYNNTYEEYSITPTDRVFIPGFPLGILGTSGFPLWKSGLIASEPELDEENKPIIWVDDLPFPGMSGSPVYYISKDYKKKNGESGTFMGGELTLFMGVFSHGNINGVYGALWKSTYLKSIFNKLP